MMTATDGREMVEALHPDPAKAGTRVNRAQYEAYRAALERVIPSDDEGVAYAELATLVDPMIADEHRSASGGCGWWVTTVKLDLEARGVIERVPGVRPQRVRRCT